VEVSIRMTFIVNVEGAIFNSNKWLIIKRSEEEEHMPGVLSLVGGKVETDQVEEGILEKTLKREILEEVDIKIHDKVYYLKSNTFFTEKKECVIDIVFLCQYASGSAKCSSVNEVSEVMWLPMEEVLNNQKAPPWLKSSISIANKMKQEIFNEAT